jgi:hypothetical protein
VSETLCDPCRGLARPDLRLGIRPGDFALHGGCRRTGGSPNGAIVNGDILEVNSKIMYLEPTVEEVAEGVWSIGGYSIANTTVIEGENGL